MIDTQLVDARNFDAIAPRIVAAMAAAPFVGIDCETQDDNRHDGLNQFCGYNPETRKKAANKKLVFDIRRTVMTGLSLFPEGHNVAYYINLNHADVENRVPFEKVREILDARKTGALWLAHNAEFEITMFGEAVGYELKDIVCTLQMAVSAYNPDEYAKEDFISAGRGGIASLVPELLRASRGYDGKTMSGELSDLVYKVIAKESSAAHSYNGFIKEIAYGYGLKRLVKSWFNYDMTTFEEVLNGKAHMGQLTGEEVASYGADDAYWAVRVFRKMLDHMAQNAPSAIQAFFEQENPMVPIFSDMHRTGMRVNLPAIHERREMEREENANVLKEMKEAVLQLLPFPDEPHEGLFKRDTNWYPKNFAKYRGQIEKWAKSPNSDDAFEQCQQARGAVSNAWAKERGQKESTGVNLSHYMPMRTLMYDLLREKTIVSDGKTQSDGEARGKLKDRVKDENAIKMLECMTKLAGIEQRMKLYLTPYTLLCDPETGRLYPVISSELATRRMGAETPNPMQLAKRGESTYVRGFFEADEDDHVIVSIDWSAIELVIIGEQSQDPEFLKAYGQIPHEDLHLGAAADVLAADVPGLNEDIFRELKNPDLAKTFVERYSGTLGNIERLFTNTKGEPLPPEKAIKYWRTEVGKGSNFNFWYSGWLGTIGERMGWDQDKTAEATERYINRFSVAEEWRLDTIRRGQADGFITLPDGHRRVRFESTMQWFDLFLGKFQLDNCSEYNQVIRHIAQKIQKRSHNQLVNAMVQGTCATIAKRSLIRVGKEIKARGWDHRIARPMMAIHDELLWSVNRKYVAEFIKMARGIMIDHPDLFPTCKLDASPSVGLTFEPWSDIKAPTGQLELYELPSIGIGEIGGRANDNEISEVVEYLYDQRAKLAA